jgi:hypothetical protein
LIVNAKEWERYFRRNIFVVGALIAKGDDLPINALDKEHVLGVRMADVERLIAEGKLPAVVSN